LQVADERVRVEFVNGGRRPTIEPDEILVQPTAVRVDGLGVATAEFDQVQPCSGMRLGRDGGKAVPGNRALVRDMHTLRT
jgi:hypothetical protein